MLFSSSVHKITSVINTVFNTHGTRMHMYVSNPGAVKCAVNLLDSCEVIALPTDTVYGLACSAVSAKAIARLYSIKERIESKPLAICLGSVGDVSRWAYVDHLPNGLLKALLPGPVTLVLRASAPVHLSLISNGRIGIRVPDNSFIRAVVSKLNYPIALTSANSSGEPSSIATHEFKSLWPQLKAVFDQGSLGRNGTNQRDGSTVVDLSRPGFYKILRAGVAFDQTKFTLVQYGLEDNQ